MLYMSPESLRRHRRTRPLPPRRKRKPRHSPPDPPQPQSPPSPPRRKRKPRPSPPDPPQPQSPPSPPRRKRKPRPSPPDPPQPQPRSSPPRRKRKPRPSPPPSPRSGSSLSNFCGDGCGVNDEDYIKINMNDVVYKKLSEKIRNIKKKGLPLLLKINSHPCAGKTTFVNRHKGFYKGCKIYDFDKLPKNIKSSTILVNKKCNSIILGGYTGGDEKTRELDYNIYENVIYIYTFPKLSQLYENINKRQKRRRDPWSKTDNILKCRNNMYKYIINGQKLISPFFYSFNEGIDYCVQEYNK